MCWSYGDPEKDGLKEVIKEACVVDHAGSVVLEYLLAGKFSHIVVANISNLRKITNDSVLHLVEKKATCAWRKLANCTTCCYFYSGSNFKLCACFE